MIYAAVVLILFSLYYLISFAKFTWKESKSSSIGSIILAIASVVFPAVAFYMR